MFKNICTLIVFGYSIWWTGDKIWEYFNSTPAPVVAQRENAARIIVVDPNTGRDRIAWTKE